MSSFRIQNNTHRPSKHSIDTKLMGPNKKSQPTHYTHAHAFINMKIIKLSHVRVPIHPQQAAAATTPTSRACKQQNPYQYAQIIEHTAARAKTLKQPLFGGVRAFCVKTRCVTFAYTLKMLNIFRECCVCLCECCARNPLAARL